MLLCIDYYIAVRAYMNGPITEQQRFTVTIAVPRIVDKYYYRIKGDLYQAIYQIVDASTYNNTSSSSKKQSITMKTMFMPIRIYRNSYATTDSNQNDLKFTTYVSRIFNKNVPLVEYFLAKFGLEGTLKYLKLNGIINIGGLYDEYSPYVEQNYHFAVEDVHITVPKYIFDNDLVVQATTMTIYNRCCSKNILEKDESLLSKIFDNDFWKILLSSRFTSMTSVEKGYSILDSLECTYDMITKEDILLPDEDKSDIYGILRWLLREFNALRCKDNVDLSTKKVRRGPYMAVAYASKFSKGIYRANDQKKITCKEIRRWIDVQPDFLLDYITKDKLVPYRNQVNDNDGITSLKYSYKGTQGIEGTPPDAYRRIQPSHFGRVDPDASSASDPGMTGILCPLGDIRNGNFNSTNQAEPNNWEANFDELIQEFRVVRGQRELIQFKKELSMIDDLEADLLLQNNKSAETAIKSAIDLYSYTEDTMEEVVTLPTTSNCLIVFDDAM